LDENIHKIRIKIHLRGLKMQENSKRVTKNLFNQQILVECAVNPKFGSYTLICIFGDEWMETEQK
jgi:hypothetical protein